MEDKDKIDGLLQLAKIHRDQFDERRRTEWKLVFTVLAFYFSLITVKITKQINLKNDQYWITALVIFGIAIVAGVYLAFIHNANHKNKSAAGNAENAAEELLGYKGKIFKKTKEITKKHPWFNWSSFSQWLLIGFISLGTYMIFTS